MAEKRCIQNFILTLKELGLLQMPEHKIHDGMKISLKLVKC